MKVSNVFRRYHRQTAIMMCLPLTLTVLTGMAYPVFDEWLSLHKAAGFILKIHSGAILGIEGIYPLLNGLGLIGLLVTGLSMTSLMRKKRALAEIPTTEQSQMAQELAQREQELANR